MKLYEIDSNLRALWTKIESQDGELTEEDIEMLEGLEIEKTEKVKGYGVIIREIMSDITEVNQEIDRLKKIAKRLQGKADYLTNSLSSFMLGNDMKEFESLEVNISFRKSTKLEIAEGAKLAKKWMRVKTEIDKQALKDFIANGGKVKGCQIVENQNIQIK